MMKSLRIRWSGLAAAAAALLAACSFAPPTPPVARVEPAADTLYGVVLADNYRWLRDRESPEVIEYLEAENEYTAKMMVHTEGLQERLYDEMVSRISETDVSVPARDGAWYYYERDIEGEQYPIHCRRGVGPGAAEEVTLDENSLAAEREFSAVEIIEVSPSGRYLAFTHDTTGRELFRIRVRDLATGEMLPDEIPNADYSIAWSADDEWIFYTVQDEALRPYKVYRHRLGTPVEQDVEAYHEVDERYRTYVENSKDDRFLLLTTVSNVSSEVLYLKADRPEGDFRVIEPRRHEIEYYAEHQGDRFVMLTNDDALNFRIVSAPDDDPGRGNWRDLVAHREDALIEDFEVFAGYVAFVELREAMRRILVQPDGEAEAHEIAFDEAVCYPSFGDNYEFDSDSLRLDYASYATPDVVYDYHMGTRDLVERKRDEFDGYDPGQYESSLISLPARDGETIPVTIVMRRDLPDGSHPMKLNGYGAYGITDEPVFSATFASLLDRGVILAQAHVRGSSAKGRSWYLDGKFLNKRNSFTDFIDCAEGLIDAGYTTADQLMISGGSAGGLLLGGVLNMRPELFTGAVLYVPFVDIMNTMLDESIPLTVTEYDEWGNPNEEKFFRYMRSYSPYDNVAAQDYPPMIVSAGLNDPRVQYWEPAKLVAKLRAMKTDDNLLMLNTEMGGHLGASGRYNWLREAAFYYAFILTTLGIAE